VQPAEAQSLRLAQWIATAALHLQSDPVQTAHKGLQKYECCLRS
jgi:hypothetical protein